MTKFLLQLFPKSENGKLSTDKLSFLKFQKSFQAGPSFEKDLELHVFSDASEFAYRAAAYLKVTSENVVTVSLIMGKLSVALIKSLSIPILKLTAAFVAAKKAKSIFKTNLITEISLSASGQTK